jgi:hypothetical protein
MTTKYPRLGLTAACAVLLLATGACDRLKRHGDGEPLPPASASDTAAAEKAVAEAKADTAGVADPADAAATAEAAPTTPETAAPAEKK